MTPPAEAGEPLLRELEARLDRASEAAEALIAQAAAAAVGSGAADSAPAGAAAAGSRTGEPSPHPPPAGWQAPGAGAQPPAGPDLEGLIRAVLSLRELIPPELQRRLGEALRDLLVALRALLDWYLTRLERGTDEPAVVQDIPIL